MKTDKAADQLRWKSARIIGREEISRFRDAVVKEQEEYLHAVGVAMERMSLV